MTNPNRTGDTLLDMAARHFQLSADSLDALEGRNTGSHYHRPVELDRLPQSIGLNAKLGGRCLVSIVC